MTIIDGEFDEDSLGEEQSDIEEPDGTAEWEDEEFNEVGPDDFEEYNRNEANDYANEGEDSLTDNDSSDDPADANNDDGE